MHILRMRGGRYVKSLSIVPAHCTYFKSGPTYSFTSLECGILSFPLPYCPSWATHAFRSRLILIPPLLSSPSHLLLSDTLFLLLSAPSGISCTPVIASTFRIASLFTSLPPEGSRLLQDQDLASSISLPSIEVFFLFF